MTIQGKWNHYLSMISCGDMHRSFQHMHCKGFVADRLLQHAMRIYFFWCNYFHQYTVGNIM
jgi:hypothetical protein